MTPPDTAITASAMEHSLHAALTPTALQVLDAVAFAQSTQDVAEIVKICARYGVPIIPFGTGTSLEGHITAPLGGVSLDVSQMNQVLAVRATRRQHALVGRFLRQVAESARRQVLIEATIVEVELTREFETGVDWSRLTGSASPQFVQNSSNLLSDTALRGTVPLAARLTRCRVPPRPLL